MLRKQALNNLTVPKNRKPKFDVKLNIIDLTNIPLVVGKVYVKWHLPSSSSAEHRGKTDRKPIVDHRATFDFTKDLTIKLTIDKNLALQPCEINFEIVQEYHDAGRGGGRVDLGNVVLNLAEYANPAEPNAEDEVDADGDNGMIVRRYLMHESKVNATLKVGIALKQTEGDTNFIPPPLRSAMMVGGIEGIMNTDAGVADDMPSMANKSRELAEAQDIYRRTLAASWACERGELPPDKLIEDLFAGGDGGKMNVPKLFRPLAEGWSRAMQDDSSNSSDLDVRQSSRLGLLTPEMAKTTHRRDGSGNDPPAGFHSSTTHGVSGRGSIEQQMQHSQPSHHHTHSRDRHHHHHHHNHHRRKGQREYREITEFDLRDDLRSWDIKAT